MPTTFSNIAPIRRVAVGDCPGPLGSGFDALARSAYSALLAAEWTEDSSAPFLPVHDNGQTANKSIPHGDAWKCTYGFDAAARTERSACGAVCYTFPVPADALTGSACNVSAISFRVTGDRYLEDGADVHVILDANAAPPSVATLAARTPNATVCATSSQTEPPNRRHGVTADVEIDPGVAATAYIHIALLLHDYTGNRGAWIEGGAMLEGAAVTIVFSREVASDGATGISLFAVTGPDEPTVPDFAHTQTLGFYAGSLYYRYASDPLTSGADPKRMISLFAAGALFYKYQLLCFKIDSDPCIIKSLIERTEGENSRNIHFRVGSTAYHNPRVPLAGRSIVVPNVTSTSAARVRVGFVQSASNPGAGSEQSDEAVFFAVPWDQLLIGEGADVLGFVDVDLSANTATNVSVPFAKTPNKDFVYPIAFPIDGSQTEVTVKNSTSSTTPPWRLNT